MSTTVPLTRGATLALTLSFQNDDGSAFDTTSCTISSSVMDAAGGYIATPALAPVAGLVGVLTYEVADTSQFPIGLLSSDIRFVNPQGQVMNSDVFGIEVTPGVTGG